MIVKILKYNNYNQTDKHVMKIILSRTQQMSKSPPILHITGYGKN